MRWFAAHYLQDADAGDPRASVLAAPDLCGLPPDLCATAEYDLLRDEGRAHAEALVAAGVPVLHHHGAGPVHGYCGATYLSAAAAAETARVPACSARRWQVGELAVGQT